MALITHHRQKQLLQHHHRCRRQQQLQQRRQSCSRWRQTPLQQPSPVPQKLLQRRLSAAKVKRKRIRNMTRIVPHCKKCKCAPVCFCKVAPCILNLCAEVMRRMQLAMRFNECNCMFMQCMAFRVACARESVFASRSCTALFLATAWLSGQYVGTDS